MLISGSGGFCTQLITCWVFRCRRCRFSLRIKSLSDNLLVCSQLVWLLLVGKTMKISHQAAHQVVCCCAFRFILYFKKNTFRGNVRRKRSSRRRRREGLGRCQQHDTSWWKTAITVTMATDVMKSFITSFRCSESVIWMNYDTFTMCYSAHSETSDRFNLQSFLLIYLLDGFFPLQSQWGRYYTELWCQITGGGTGQSVEGTES